jgi:hypothetical protein
MPRRREIRNAAQGLLGSFVSRNNDVDGYWGIGKLYSAAKSARTKIISLDLIDLKVTPDIDGFDHLLRKYADLLVKQFPKRLPTSSWLSEAKITIEFESHVDPSDIPRWFTIGEPFSCIVLLADTHNRKCETKAFGRCKMHDPNTESRSTRIYR